MNVFVISLISSYVMCSFNLSSSHPLSEYFITSLFFSTILLLGLFVVIFIPSIVGIHLSSQKLIFSPLPTSHLIPYFNRSLPFIMFFYSHELLLLHFASIRFLFGKYNSFRNLVHRLSGLVNILHACFASNALL